MTTAYDKMMGRHFDDDPAGTSLKETQTLDASLKTDMSLAQETAKTELSTQGALSDFGDQMQAQYGEGMRGGWQGALMTFINGAKSAKKRDVLEKLGTTMQSLQDISHRAASDKAETLRARAAFEAVTPDIKNYIKNASNLTTGGRKAAVANLVERFNEKGNTDFKVYSIDGQNPAKVTLTSKQHGGVPIDLMDSPLGEGMRQEQQRKDYGKMVKENEEAKTTALQDKRIIDKQRVAAYEKDVDNRWKPAAQFDRAAATKQGALGAINKKDIQKENKAFKIKLNDLNALEGVLKNGKPIFGNNLSADIKMHMGKVLQTKAYTDTQVYNGLSAMLVTAFRDMDQKFGNVSDKDFAFIQRGIPDSEKTKEASAKLINFARNKINYQMALNDHELSGYQDFNPQELALPQPKPEVKPIPEGMVRVLSPDKKRRADIPKGKAKEFLDKQWTLD